MAWNAPESVAVGDGMLHPRLNMGSGKSHLLLHEFSRMAAFAPRWKPVEWTETSRATLDRICRRIAGKSAPRRRRPRRVQRKIDQRFGALHYADATWHYIAWKMRHEARRPIPDRLIDTACMGAWAPAWGVDR